MELAFCFIPGQFATDLPSKLTFAQQGCWPNPASEARRVLADGGDTTPSWLPRALLGPGSPGRAGPKAPQGPPRHCRPPSPRPLRVWWAAAPARRLTAGRLPLPLRPPPPGGREAGR